MRWAITQMEAPAEEPVTLAEAKAHVRIEESVTAEDSWINAAIVAAREYCESFQGRVYISRKLRLSLERWPRGGEIRLPRPPLVSVESVTYLLEDGAEATLDPGTYVVETAAEPGTVLLKPGLSWPSDTLQPGLPVRVDYTAGYGDASQVPRSAKHAMLLLIGHWMASRETVVIGTISRELEFTTAALLYPHRFWYSGPEV